MFDRIRTLGWIVVTAFVVSGAVESNCTLAQCWMNESAKFIAPDGAATDYFGFAVDISGAKAVVGTYLDDDYGSNSGSVHVLGLDDGNWVRQAKLLASDGQEDDWFGWSVAISGDTIVVGANRDGDAGAWTGSAYIFRFDGSSWLQQAKLLADGAGYYWEEFGFDVAISDDGNTVLIGACKANDNGFKSGAAYVFGFDGSKWRQRAKLLASDGVELATFGNGVAISDDGNTALIGAPGYDATGSKAGSAYVFGFNGTKWIERQKLVASDASNTDHLGHDLAISGDIAVIGAYGDDNAAPDDVYCNSGSAYVFGFDGSSWVEQAKLQLPEGKCGNQFGWAVAISGKTIVVGAPDGHWGTTYGPGFAEVFRSNGFRWIYKARLTCSDATYGDHFGFSVGTSGGVALVGSDWDDDIGPESGSMYVFNLAWCLGDFDCDGDVDFTDFAIFASAWWTAPGDAGWNPDCDISIVIDSLIDTSDLIVFAENWLATAH